MRSVSRSRNATIARCLEGRDWCSHLAQNSATQIRKTRGYTGIAGLEVQTTHGVRSGGSRTQDRCHSPRLSPSSSMKSS